MQKNYTTIFILFITTFIYSNIYSQGLIVNEVSNGTSGSKEYMEFLVVGTPCTTVDIRGFIIDDNNGLDDLTCQGFGTTSASAGVAPGHVRFKNISRWSAIPVGTIILIYNSADKNSAITLSDDPTDSNVDSVYIVPISDSGLEVNTTLPTATSPVNCSYSPATYSSASSTSWTPISLRNTGDAAQVRNPDGSYFHGLSYGTAANNMTGGPDGLKILNADLGGKVIYFNCDNYRLSSNFTSANAGTSAETPGRANSTLNANYIKYLKCLSGDPCTITSLPIELIHFTAKCNDEIINFSWATASEKNNLFFTIEGSENGNSFSSIKKLNGNLNSSEKLEYNESITANTISGLHYFRLKQTDIDGKFSYSKLIYVSCEKNKNSFKLFPNPASTFINVESDEMPSNIIVKNSLGQEVVLKNISINNKLALIDISELPPGIYILLVQEKFHQEYVKFIKY